MSGSEQGIIAHQAFCFGCYDTIKVAFTNRNGHILNPYHHIYYELMRVLATAFPFTVIHARQTITEEPSHSTVGLTEQN